MYHNKMTYIPTHVHTGHSYLDGGIRNDDYAKLLVECGIPGGACTDHGNIANASAFHRCFSKYGLKPIIGIEAYFTRTLIERDNANLAEGRDKNEKFSHQIIIAKNFTGLKNLMKHSSLAYVKYRYKKPLLSLDYFKNIPQEERDGLIITSACLSNYIAQYLLEDDYDSAKSVALEYRDVFGEDFYLEVHPNMIDVQIKVNHGIIKIAKETGIKAIVATDSHYMCCDHAQSHDVLLAIQTNKDLVDEGRFRFSANDFYLQSDADMDEILLSHGLTQEQIDELRKNTWELYEKVEFIKSLDSKDKIVPKFDVKKQPDYNEFLKFREQNLKYTENTDYLRFKIKNGVDERFNKRGEKIPSSYINQINYEIGVFRQFDLVDYFLIVSDYCSWARSQNILVGYGRGSSAGSIINYILGITNIDPIKHGLVFERFLNPGRMETGEFPDIDCDFQHDRRHEVIEYLKSVYGKYSVSFIGTETLITPKLAFKDVCRVMQVDFQVSNKLSKDIPGEIEAKDVKDIPSIANAIKVSPSIREAIKHIEFLSGLPKNTGVHASGVIITNDDMWNYVPIKNVKSGMTGCDIVTQFDMKDCEKAGLIKFDVLGLTNLTVISNILKELDKQGIKEDFYNVDFNIKEVYDMLCVGHTIGVFQLETSLNNSITKRFMPRSLDDISLVVSICRPGSLSIVEDYIDVRFGKKEPVFIDERLKNILSETNGYIIYQEQAMEIVKQLANFSYADADILRRAIGKKEIETMEKVKEMFLEKFVGDKKIAKKIFSFIEMSQDYSFNKAHAMSYAYLAYLTAYFKYKYPGVFYSQLINEYSSDKEKVQKIIDEAIERNVKVFPPRISSFTSFTEVKDGNVYLGFNLLKGMGDSVLTKFKSANKLFSSLKEDDRHNAIKMIYSMIEAGVPQNVADAIIKVGCINDYGLNVNQCLLIDSNLREAKAKLKTRKKILVRSGETNPKWLETFEQYMSNSIPDMKDIKNEEKRQYEKEFLEFTISENPLKRREQEILEKTDELNIDSLEDGQQLKLVAEVFETRPLKTKKDDKDMMVGTLKTLTTKIKFVIFPRQYHMYKDLFEKGRIVIMSGKISEDDYGKQIIVQECRKFNV